MRTCTQLAGVVFLALVTFGVAPAAQAQRDPVLKQVSVPHSYYWREMYIPQLTSGPSGLAWSRDGASLIYSMQGRLWRQKIVAGTAERITAGAGYDYQPDVSPDGQRVVFARYQKDAIELVIHELKSGNETALTANGAVNVDPRWSPDGTRIAYVTTAESGKFHIAIAEENAGAWTSRRWRPERTSKTPRYYYSQVDHELSPAWTPDGASLVFVANPEIGYGTGAIFRQPLDLSAPAAELQREETAWKTHPDVSPDGKRVAYASFLGRQWHQLWMIATDGGNPISYSYGEFDIVAARWSPDGSRIAYISNESGDGAIWIQDVVGGARRALAIAKRKSAQPMGGLEIETAGADGEPLAARLSIRGSDGRDYAPDEAVIHADDSYDREWGPAETHYFHTPGRSVIALPTGTATISVWRGLETEPQQRTVEIRKGETARLSLTLASNDLEGAFAGWVSGDVHVHMNYGGAYRMTPPRLAFQADAEDLDLVFNLIVNKEQRVPDIGYFSPQPARPEGAGAVIAQSQEFHTSVWGHLGLIGLDDHILIGDYAGYPKTAAHSLYPDNAAVAELAHAQSALVGYVHPFDPPPPDPFSDQKLTYALPVEIALGGIDYVEIVGFSDHRITEEIWERLLNCGFRIPAAGGTDAMSNFASLRGPVGLNRTYVKLDDAPGEPEALMRAWLAGLKAGRSFATNGPLLSLEVSGAGPGEDLRLKRGARLAYTVKMTSIAPVDALELIVNGKVAATIPLNDDKLRAEYSGAIDIAESGWIALRASSRDASPLVFDLYPFAVTSPVYVDVDGKPLRSREDAEFFIAWIEKLEAFARASEAYNSENERKAVLAHLRKAKVEFARRR